MANPGGSSCRLRYHCAEILVRRICAVWRGRRKTAPPLPISCGFSVPFRSLGAAKILVGLHTPDRSTVDRRKLRCLLGRALPRAVRNTGHLRWQCSGTMGGRRQDGTASKRPARAAQPTSTRHFPKCGCGNSGPPRSVQFARQCCRTVLRPGSMNMETT
jgi:hypothetical protein